MDEKIFEKLGLTQGEIKTYLALTKLGECTVGPLVHASKVTKSKIYDILERLISKGLVGYVVKNNTKHFTSNNPNTLLDFINKKEDELQFVRQEITTLLPQLRAVRNTGTKERTAEIYEGYQGMKSIREELMKTFKKNDCLVVLGAPKIANEKWEGWLLDFHKRRIANKIYMKIIYNHDAKEYGSIRKNMPLTEVRYLPPGLATPTWIDVFPQAVLIATMAKDIIVFVVRDKDVADSFRNYHSLMWNMSKK
jgi:HTH-type transcriptional regulator, sugar sensing transcriptional regulator